MAIRGGSPLLRRPEKISASECAWSVRLVTRSNPPVTSRVSRLTAKRTMSEPESPSGSCLAVSFSHCRWAGVRKTVTR